MQYWECWGSMPREQYQQLLAARESRVWQEQTVQGIESGIVKCWRIKQGTDLEWSWSHTKEFRLSPAQSSQIIEFENKWNKYGPLLVTLSHDAKSRYGFRFLQLNLCPNQPWRNSGVPVTHDHIIYTFIGLASFF